MLAASEIIFNRPLAPEVLERRAALSLTKVYPGHHAADAPAVLPPALEAFSPTPESPEIVETQTLLAADSRDILIGDEQSVAHKNQRCRAGTTRDSLALVCSPMEDFQCFGFQHLLLC